MSLQIWLPLNGDLKNYGLQSLSTVSNNGATVNNNGKLGQCYSFNGSSNYIYYPSTSGPINIKEYSLSFWIYSTSTTATQDIISCRTAVGSGISIFLISGKVRWDIGGNNIQWTTTYSYPANKWFHIAVTYDGATAKLYVNGQYSQSYSTSAVSSTYLGNTVSFGSSQANGTGYGNYLNGRLNDIRIYDHCLSAKEVEEISKGLVIHLKLDNQDYKYGNPNILTGTFENSYRTGADYTTGWANSFWCGGSGGNGVFSVTEDNTVPVGKYSWNITDNTTGNRDFYQYKIPYINGTVYVASFYAKGNGTCLWRSYGNSTAQQSKTWTLTSSWTRYTYSFTANSAQQTYTCSYQVGLQGAGNINICGMKLETGNTATAYNTFIGENGYQQNIIYDCSGYRHNALPYNTSLAVNSPRYDKGAVFNGSTTFVRVEDSKWSGQGTTELSINTWVKFTAWGGRIWSCTESGGLYLISDTASSGYLKLTFYLYSNAAQTTASYVNWNDAIPLSALSLNQWYMITVTYTTAGAKIYLDGELYNTLSSTNYGISFNLTNRLMLGAEPSQASFAQCPTGNGSTYFFNGQQSDFRIYATALSASQIKELYNTSATVDNIGNVYARQFKEVVLPSGYTLLNYLESNGSQYINLGKAINGITPYKIKFQVMTSNSVINGGIFGAFATTWANDGYGLVYFFYNSNYQLRTYLNATVSSGTLVYQSSPYTEYSEVELDDSLNQYLNGEYKVTADSTRTWTATKNAYLFKVNSTNTSGGGFPIRIYYFECDNIRCYPAMRNSDSVVGMYDVGRNQFLTNAGTGTFTYG